MELRLIRAMIDRITLSVCRSFGKTDIFADEAEMVLKRRLMNSIAIFFSFFFIKNELKDEKRITILIYFWIRSNFIPIASHSIDVLIIKNIVANGSKHNEKPSTKKVETLCEQKCHKRNPFFVRLAENNRKRK